MLLAACGECELGAGSTQHGRHEHAHGPRHRRHHYHYHVTMPVARRFEKADCVRDVDVLAWSTLCLTVSEAPTSPPLVSRVCVLGNVCTPQPLSLRAGSVAGKALRCSRGVAESGGARCAAVICGAGGFLQLLVC